MTNDDQRKMPLTKDEVSTVESSASDIGSGPASKELKAVDSDFSDESTSGISDGDVAADPDIPGPPPEEDCWVINETYWVYWRIKLAKGVSNPFSSKLPNAPKDGDICGERIVYTKFSDGSIVIATDILGAPKTRTGTAFRAHGVFLPNP